MNVYNAIMQAADHIERHPKEFNYRATGIPEAPGCGTPGCAIGWIGTFSDRALSMHPWANGDPFHSGIGTAARNILGIDSMEFYIRMNQFGSGWTSDAKACAASLRRYANKYHGDGKPATKSDAALVADLMARVYGAKISEAAPSPELVS